MKYKSTNHKSPEVSFKNAVVKGLADDKGLFFPVEIPKLPESFFKKLSRLSLREIGHEVLKPYVGDDLSDNELKALLDDALNFDIPLVEIKPQIFSLELFHGPTLAFKDVGARIMARFLSKFVDKNKKVTVLVATSGDTGSAVANGFLNVEGIDVVVLYPKGMVSNIQEKQFTTLGSNIAALEVNGTFDDCQRMVKEAFADIDLNNTLQLSSANSINVARFLPQAIYYFYAYAQLKDKSKPVVFSVPSGNYGNLTAGIIAKRSGLPVHNFIASANINNVVPEYLRTGVFNPLSSVSTISNAMDVGNPSNFARIMELYSHSWGKIKLEIEGYSFTDEETRQIIFDVYQKHEYILDPHGAVAYLGLSEYMKKNDVNGIFFETAHPAKFYETVEKQISVKVDIPERLEKFLSKEKNTIEIGNSLDNLKQVLLN
ncbi:MAG: threonine synthase [Bacteroidetes bacterium]|nr:MAG: threonine synthase [Bacteroidota bacterium]